MTAFHNSWPDATWIVLPPCVSRTARGGVLSAYLMVLRMMYRVLLYTAMVGTIMSLFKRLLGEALMAVKPEYTMIEFATKIRILLYPTISFHSFWCFLRSSLPILANCAAVHPPPSYFRTASDRALSTPSAKQLAWMRTPRFL